MATGLGNGRGAGGALRSIHRAESLRSIRPAQARTLEGLFARVAAGWEWMEITQPVRARAATRFPHEPVRSLDAIHLSTMLEFIAVYPDLSVLTLDERVAKNAVALGLVAKPPARE